MNSLITSTSTPTKHRQTTTTSPKIWAVGGGKGGVGKSFVSANLGMSLSEKGYRVVVMDMDLGSANLHSFLGMPHPAKSLSDFIEREVESLDEVVLPTDIPRLSTVSGAQDSNHVANLKHAHKIRLLRAIRSIDADYVILDLGAGTTFNTLDFFSLASTHLIVVAPEPTSIENAYRFIKSAFYRKIRLTGPDTQSRHVIDEVMHPKNSLGIRTPQGLSEYFKTLDPRYYNFVEKQLQEFCPHLIINQVRSENDQRIGNSMVQACKKHFGIQLQFVGCVPHDLDVGRSIMQRRPFLIQYPDASAIPRLQHICQHLMNRQH